MTEITWVRGGNRCHFCGKRYPYPHASFSAIHHHNGGGVPSSSSSAPSYAGTCGGRLVYLMRRAERTAEKFAVGIQAQPLVRTRERASFHL